MLRANHLSQVAVDGTGKLTPCSPGDSGATEMNWMQIDSESLLEPPLRVRDLSRRSRAQDRRSVARIRGVMKTGRRNLGVRAHSYMRPSGCSSGFTWHGVVSRRCTGALTDRASIGRGVEWVKFHDFESAELGTESEEPALQSHAEKLAIHQSGLSRVNMEHGESSAMCTSTAPTLSIFPCV